MSRYKGGPQNSPSGHTNQMKTHDEQVEAFRRVQRRYPHLEDDDIWALVGYTPTQRSIEAGSAPWVDGRASRGAVRWHGPVPEVASENPLDRPVCRFAVARPEDRVPLRCPSMEACAVGACVKFELQRKEMR